ncbi:immunity protein YezG family protein [Bradyrhizobium sp. sBnM-33]|uniref:immunity protein YezG family protein n=1 Tax=Bradyrhizobium sp. sBnM-33 TaxID=2831780 RepID=UPI001BCDFD16|nr:immunity protein YezG family protein [Bradyrhizobium sp. sBnM-33]WOH53612.1 DUF600 family protein [Bradyrhizobium sp. sBnM-33]
MAELSTVEEIYDFVANAMAAAVDEPWREIRLETEIWKTSTGFTGDYTRDPAERGVADLDVDRLDYAVAKAIKKLQTIMASTAHEPWNKATFRVTPDGEFFANFAYDADLSARLDAAATRARQQ